MSDSSRRWPSLFFEDGVATYSALHLWSQIIGKYRFAHAPWVNHSWQATLYVTPRGLTTGLVPDRKRPLIVDLDFCSHQFIVRSDRGDVETFSLQRMSVADFFRQAKRAITAAGGSPNIHGVPNEVSDPIPFAEDTKVRPYSADAAESFHLALLKIEPVFNQFRTGFVGKVSPVHLFWGAFDLAVTRFSGRKAPLHPGGMPGLPDPVAREAYSHEVSSAGFWLGGGEVKEPMFYSYAYPEPKGYRSWNAKPTAAYFDMKLGEFLLPYEAVRTSEDPEGLLLEFLNSTYRAAAELGEWDREALECEPGRPRIPREIGNFNQTSFEKGSAAIHSQLT